MNKYDNLQPLIFFDTMNFGEIMKLKRVHDRLTQLQLAEIIGCGYTTISEVETGKKRPPYKYLEAMKDYLYHDHYIDGVLQKDE